MLFIGLVMGHWSLFVAYSLYYIASLCTLGASIAAYDQSPASWKGEDKDGDGVPDDEQELLRKAGMDPITKLVTDRAEKKAEEERKKTEATENLVETMLDLDE